jgi:YfiR/HmsC-like
MCVTTSKRFLAAGVAVVILFWGCLGCPGNRARGAEALDDASKEYQIKAAFIFNFALFTAWPDSAFSAPNAPFVVAVIGDDPFGPALQQVMSGKSISGHPITVKHLDSRAQISGCHLLFVPASEDDRLGDIFNIVGNRPILTVGETSKFLWAGGIIRFLIADGKIRFEIAPDAADKAGLRLSSRLMNLAKIFKKN